MINLNTLATLIIASGSLSLLSLLILHIVSPEFKPGLRMVSEYALGKHKWLITSFFLFWALSAFLAAYFYYSAATSTWARIGAILVAVSGLGALMGGLFDVKHKLHGFAFALGVPTMPVGALLLAANLAPQLPWAPHATLVWVAAHAVWVSLVLMAVTMIKFFAGLKKAGIPFGPDQEPLKEAPAGMVAVHGYANRLLVLVYVGFNMLLAGLYL